jgi:prepilin-type N-terminal cleavage/methylation domain-containing protein
LLLIDGVEKPIRADISPGSSETPTMKYRLIAGRNNRGFSITELVVVMAVLGILTSMALPQLLSYLRVATSNAGRDEMRGALGRAKQLAITRRQNICVAVSAGSPPTYQFRQGNCDGPAWIGPGSNAAGNFTLASAVVLANGGANPIFTPLGTAAQAGRLSVAPHSGGSPQTVTVTTAGRITVP